MNRRSLAVGLMMVLAAVQPVAAIWVPQTRQEFVKAVAAGARATTTEKFVVERDIDQVYGVLKEKCTGRAPQAPRLRPAGSTSWPPI